MNLIQKHFNKESLHHAYLIEGNRDEVVPEVFEFLKTLKISTEGNPDLVNITIDNFKIDEALELRGMSVDKSFSSAKKIFIVCANTISLDAENVLLKMFEEPKTDTHFFLIVPDKNTLLKTLLSRFYVISPIPGIGEESKEAEAFIAMSVSSRIDFIKELLIEPEEEDTEGNEIVVLDSARSKALKFLNAIEQALHSKLLKNYAGSSLSGLPDGSHTDPNFLTTCFAHFFKVREFLRMPGSSTKSLMEGVALVIPNF